MRLADGGYVARVELGDYDERKDIKRRCSVRNDLAGTIRLYGCW